MHVCVAPTDRVWDARSVLVFFLPPFFFQRPVCASDYFFFWGFGFLLGGGGLVLGWGEGPCVAFLVLGVQGWGGADKTRDITSKL